MRKKIKLLVSAPLDFLPDIKSQISDEFDCKFEKDSDLTEITKILSNDKYEAWMTNPCPTYNIDGNLFDLCPTIKIISTPSTGSNHINFPDAKYRKIKVYTLKGSNIINTIKASSEFTFNLMISVIRKTPYAFNGVLKGEWRESEEKYRGRELDGLTLGIIGYGRIGSNLSKYSKAFNMNILAFDPYIDIKDSKVTKCNSITDLLNSSDVVATCVHLNEETFNLVNDNFFKEMKNNSYFINTSRGDVVNENALINNLKNGKILAAGVDVISNEFTSNKKGHPLIEYAKNNDNLIITPHIAGLTYDSERKAQKAAFAAIKDYFMKGN